ncbi:MAG: acyl--CoA ligase [Gammaproteobacteria bacterium]|nr:acyl--CoA ligase [Gammaproteobacteria bacterium]MDE1887162.1 acyl--CoA ligase [Gammaproteobacteria bacterium]MDE2023372.1 acyl--CoA ligase [Gammaproteobacteria bacterium]MDE2139739.1 acyl--CoA ligase [Gammaproteobacteria bacterium]
MRNVIPTRPVAISEHGALDQTAFWRRVHGLRAALASQPAQRVALVCEDSGWFAAGMLALAQTGRICVVPQAPQAGSITASGAHVGAVLTDRPGEFTEFTTLAIGDAPPAGDATASLPDDDVCIECYTSGSSGMPKCVLKAFGQLRREVAALEQQWGEQLGDALVLGTIPHYHLYGTLVRVLWPLLAGRTFVTHTCVQAAELRRWAAQHRCVIVSSPAFLQRIAAPAELPPAAQVAAVFSSGAPLADPFAERLQRDWGHAPIEIYGSTETGGVAWRVWSGSAERPYWRLLPGVQTELREEPAGMRLWVKSGFTWQSGWMATGDLARRHDDGRLVLLGRADDVVKLEDKRVSLSEMRTRLMAHAWVENVRLLLLAGPRRSIGAVVILNAAGRRQLAANGKLPTSRELRNWLRRSYEPVLLPRKWRFPEALPDNDMGKIEHANLQQLFARRA